MNIPATLQYSKSHEWVKFTSKDTALVGLTDFAQDQLGSLVFVNLPEVGDEFEVGDTLGDVESVKAVSDIYAPVGGTISSVNEELLDTPEAINQSPYDAWLVEISAISDQDDLLSASEYKVHCLEEG
ncbi:MAG: Glycine cleavage system protein [Evtepia sp.]|jgi:glycine cleavage system H protein|nr:Glycine cleavage system protein [Evtepia sp.]